MGPPWFAAFTQFTDRDGFIDSDPDWQRSPLEGGHEVCLVALETVATDDGRLMPEHTVLRFRNSWGPYWSDHGDGRLYLSTYCALRDQIDLIQPRLAGARP